MISIMLPRAQVSANRINEILEKEPRIKDNENTKNLTTVRKDWWNLKMFHLDIQMQMQKY